MIPAFNENGLLPAGEHPCSLSEIQVSFCWNSHRESLYAKLCDFLRIEWEGRIDNPLYVDGSFVRNKDMPEDIDVVIDVSTENDVNIVGKALRLHIIERARIKAQYDVDLWIRHPSIPNDLVQFFQYIGIKACAELSLPSDHPKGILRIAP